MSKNTFDEVLLYNMLDRDADKDNGGNNSPPKTLKDLSAFLESKFADKPEVLARIENLPGYMERRAAASMLKEGKPLEYISDFLERISDQHARSQSKWLAKDAGEHAGRVAKELGWDDRTARHVWKMAQGEAFHEKWHDTGNPDREDGFDFREHGEMAAIKFHLHIPPEGISLYEAYESMVITDEWSDGQVQEVDVVRHIQEVEGGQEPSQSGFAIELAAKLRAAIDSGADPDMPLEKAMQLRDVMAPFDPKPFSQSEATQQRMENIEQKAEKMLNEVGPARPPAFDI